MGVVLKNEVGMIFRVLEGGTKRLTKSASVMVVFGV